MKPGKRRERVLQRRKRGAMRLFIVPLSPWSGVIFFITWRHWRRTAKYKDWVGVVNNWAERVFFASFSYAVLSIMFHVCCCYHHHLLQNCGHETRRGGKKKKKSNWSSKYDFFFFYLQPRMLDVAEELVDTEHVRIPREEQRLMKTQENIVSSSTSLRCDALLLLTHSLKKLEN